ncbi:hypothetical protein ACH40F_07910 [Streptomyces sp. NPDC020794]|uniref:hypothetical protein n=1 Tax=unclassified Streptomyces TaxID=2593676 RepID=UPI0036E97E0B
MTKDYEPPEDAADVFARYKAHYEGERELKPSMRQMAERELKAGATVGQLARLTGLTPEVFRRMARELGIERKRPPTVGKLTHPAIAAAPTVTVRMPSAPVESKRRTEPRPVRRKPVEMTEERAAELVALVRERGTARDVEELDRRVSTVSEAYQDFARVAEAQGMGLLTQDEIDGHEGTSA